MKRVVFAVLAVAAIVAIAVAAYLVIVRFSNALCDLSGWERDVTAFLDRVRVAESTSRIALGGVIIDMQDIRRAFEARPFPFGCDGPKYAALRDATVAFMRQYEDAFLAFAEPGL